MTGKMPEEGINPEDQSHLTVHVWHWFLTLNGCRQSGMNGALPLSNLEIESFFRLEKYDPAEWELNAIRALDHVALK